MAERPRVGVTGSHRRWSPSWWSTRWTLRLLGAEAERISIRHAASGRPLAALIIGGGDDVGPEHYGGDLHAKVRSDPARDKLEMHWIEQALEQGIPLLGICRGAQLINVVLGGNLHQDIRAMRQRTHNRPGLLPTKRVSVHSTSRLAEVCDTGRLWVNSLHHQAIRTPGKGLREVAWDLDNIIQAVEAEDGRPIIGVQWHPEYLSYLPAQRALFRWLLHAVA
ncbi:gamma-glutamyl-gamma-aminobutyrate hydrolase family protein [Pseudomonas zhanjiangensis]|uniref:Gamma-glutamyl-gamma-aminobutyrate hydrolase family protein n=1 Tax=Pseudomonas zhanjiangensis TaxID=3239015 RepID=A0ABV3YPB7_9PSED